MLCIVDSLVNNLRYARAPSETWKCAFIRILMTSHRIKSHDFNVGFFCIVDLYFCLFLSFVVKLPLFAI